MVFVECGVDQGNNLKEVDWVEKQINRDPRIRGIVAKSDLSQEGSLEEEWEILQENTWVKGIRSGANAERLIDAKYIKRLQKLSKYDLSFDLHISSTAYEAAEKAIRTCKNTQFILNHIGIPDIQRGEWEPWHQGIIRLSKLPNLVCKISGVITRAGEAWTADIIKPYIFHVIESFGFERIIYGGDWPVVLRVGSYQSWVSAFEQLTHEFSQNELTRLYHLNAEQIYHL
jgi:L-fuconolactonase